MPRLESTAHSEPFKDDDRHLPEAEYINVSWRGIINRKQASHSGAGDVGQSRAVFSATQTGGGRPACFALHIIHERPGSFAPTCLYASDVMVMFVFIIGRDSLPCIMNYEEDEECHSALTIISNLHLALNNAGILYEESLAQMLRNRSG